MLSSLRIVRSSPLAARLLSSSSGSGSSLSPVVRGVAKRPDEVLYNPQAAQVALVGGVHREVSGRKAIIFEAAKSAMTSGLGNEKWTIRFNHTDKWSTPIMGYLGGADTLNQVWTHMAVETKEDAIRIAERNGWAYEVIDAPNNTTNVLKSYAFNFLSEAVGENLKKMGPRNGRVIYKQAAKNSSHWINRKRSTFGGETWSPNK